MAPKVSKGRSESPLGSEAFVASGDKEKAERVSRNERPLAATIEAADAPAGAKPLPLPKKPAQYQSPFYIQKSREPIGSLQYGIRRRPMLPGRVQPSTFGTERLNFCVRDGNRWDPLVIATGNGELFSCGGWKSSLRWLPSSSARFPLLPIPFARASLAFRRTLTTAQQ